MTGGLGRFVGRARELDDLRAALPPDATGTMVLVSGEPGIGKTSLVAEALAGTSAAVAWGTCWDGDGAPALWPWIEVVRRCLATPQGAAWRDSGDPMVDEVLALLPEAGGDTAAAAASSRFAVFEGVARLVHATAPTDGAVIVLDDLQWADAGTLSLLAFFARTLRAAPVSVLGTFRDSEIDPDHPLRVLLAELAGRVRVLPLTGLPVDDLVALSEPGAEGAALTGDEVAALHRLTGGNPFFAREVLTLARIGGRGKRLDGSRVPPGVQAVIEQRIAHLSHACADALRAAAVLGASVVPEDVALLVDRPVSEVAERLAEARTALVLVDDEEHPASWRFAHDLLRQTIYSAISPRQRAQLHALAARVLSGRPGADTSLAAAIAHHLLAATGVADPDEAIDAALRAGDQALAVMADLEAASWFERATSLARVTGPDTPRALAALLALGEARLRHGDLPRARDAYLEAASIARRTDRPDDLARAALGLGAGLGGFEVGMFDEAQIALLEEAIAAVGPGDSSWRAQLLARLSVALSFVADEGRRLQMSEDAVAMARRLGDRSTLGYALASWCDAVAGPAHSEERRDAALEVVALGEALDDRRLELLGRRLLFVALLELADIVGADVQIRTYERVAEALREPLYRWYVPLWRGMRALMAGRSAEAERFATEAEAIGAAAHSDNAAMLVLMLRWSRLRVDGELDRAASLIEAEGTEVFGPLPGVAPFMVLTDLHAGRIEEGRAGFAAMLRELDGWSQEDAEWLPTVAQAAEVAAALGDREAAARLDTLMSPFDERLVVEGIGAAVSGPVCRFRSLLADVLAREDEAEALRARASAIEEAIGLRGRPATIRLDGTAPAGSNGHRPDLGASTLAREGDVWACTFAGTTVRVRDSKGMHDLAALLTRPGHEVHVRELVVPAGELARPTLGTTGEEVLDRRAVAEYRRRLSDLDEDLAEADANNDEGRAARLATERDFLLAELSAGLGLSGRSRRMGDDVDRARKAVRARLRDAIGRIDAVHPALGLHLTRSVRTGTLCAYEPADPTVWVIQP